MSLSEGGGITDNATVGSLIPGGVIITGNVTEQALGGRL